jgi:hypothetical protein
MPKKKKDALKELDALSGALHLLRTVYRGSRANATPVTLDGLAAETGVDRVTLNRLILGLRAWVHEPNRGRIILWAKKRQVRAAS